MIAPRPSRPSWPLVALLTLTACGDSEQATIDAGPSHWRLGPALPGRRLEPSVVALGDQLVVAGGFDTSLSERLHITSDVDVLDTTTQQWLSPLPALPVAWTHANLAASGTTLLLLGGLEGSDYIARGDAWALDAGAQAWRALAPLPAGRERGASGVVASGGHVYLLGGASTTDAIATCLDYDVAANTWTELPSLPGPRSHPAAMALADGTLVVANGLRTLDSTNPLGDVWTLAPGAAGWEQRASVSAHPRGGCAYGVLEGALVCAGGEAGTSASRQVDRYDPASDRWSVLESLPEARAGSQGAVVGGSLYAVGGASALVYVPVATIFVFTP